VLDARVTFLHLPTPAYLPDTTSAHCTMAWFPVLILFNIQTLLARRPGLIRPPAAAGRSRAQWPPPLTARNWRFEILGRMNRPTMPPMSAKPDAMPNAGMFPFPNSASHGPAPRAMIT